MTPKPIECGTRAGWNLHMRRREPICQPCREANTTYMREWRRRSGRTTRTLRPIEEAT